MSFGNFFRARQIRRTVSLVAALLAFVGGALVLVTAFGRGLAAAFVPAILGVGALFGAWWIYNSGKALLFPRSRLTFSGFLTAAIGILLYVLGMGVDGLLVIAAGIVAWLATIL